MDSAVEVLFFSYAKETGIKVVFYSFNITNLRISRIHFLKRCEIWGSRKLLPVFYHPLN